MKPKMPGLPSCSSTFAIPCSSGNGQNTKNGGENLVQEEQKQSKNRWKENGFEEWGGYMEAKKAKLDVQINLEGSLKNGNLAEGSDGFGIFNGISIYINGHTIPPEPELRKLFVAHGGTVNIYRSSRTRFVIASNLSAASKNLYGDSTVKPEWISESISAGVKLNYRDYLLYNYNEEKNQRTLTQMMGGQKSAVSNGISFSIPVPELVIPDGGTVEDTKMTNELNGNAENQDDENEILPPSDEESSSVKTLNGNQNGLCETMKNIARLGSNNNNSIMTAGRKVKTATEDGFLEDFFQNSRLHLISDQKKEMQNKIGNLRKTIDTHSFDYLNEFLLQCDQNNNWSNKETPTEEPVTLMHIDLDCFFVSVGLLSRPHLRGKPVVVTHSTGKGDNSKSDIASSSYEARKFGVSNGMWVSEAKKLCPTLEVVPYDFEEYRRVSNTFFDTVARVTLDIEPMSVDEMVLDATSVLQKVPSASPTDLAEFIRRKILEAVECPASVGIGRNKLLAKLATKKAKPNGVYHLKPEDVEQYIEQLEVRELPGIGRSLESRLNEIFQVKFAHELLRIPMQNLKTEFGVKTAENMVQHCKGIDSAELKYGFDRPKSISVDVNYGIRFSKDDQLSEFLMKLCKELSNRAVRAQATGVNLTLKIMSRRKGAGEPKKHGGHGIVDTLTRSTRLFQPTSDWNDFFRMVSKVIRLLTIPASDYRGIGMSLTDLTFEFDKSANQKKSVQKTLFDMPSSSRGRQMLDVVRKNSSNKRDAVGLDQLPPLVNGNGEINSLSSGSRRSSMDPESPGKPLPPTPKRRRLDSSSSNKTVPSTSAALILFNSTNAEPPSGNASESIDLNILRGTNSVNKFITAEPPSGNASESIDLNILRELPEDIAREVAQQYGIDFSTVALKVHSDPKPLLIDSNGDDEIMKNDQPQPSTVTNGTNPYSNLESIDPGYLYALPDAIRKEVLLEFQEAKGTNRKEANVQDVNFVQDQPCSSKQALERDNKLNPIKKPVQSTETHYVVPLDSTDIESILRCDEQMYDESVYTTPPSASAATRSSTSQGRFRSRRSANSTPLSSKRRLNFSEKDTTLDMKKFWTEKSYYPPCPSSSSQLNDEALPNLQGAIDVEDVRNILREGIAVIQNPAPIDCSTLTQYFHDLVERGYLQQGQLLLKFLCRKYESLPEESPWRSIIEVIIKNSQEHCAELYDCELDLEL